MNRIFESLLFFKVHDELFNSHFRFGEFYSVNWLYSSSKLKRAKLTTERMIIERTEKTMNVVITVVTNAYYCASTGLYRAHDRSK